MNRDQAFIAYASTMHVATLLHAGVIRMEKIAGQCPEVAPPPFYSEWIERRKRQAAEHVAAADLIAAEHGL